eukprot:gnl/MRDRNA2_/MRDRNA2_35002_c0_seq1.p1 gnl/MRDRNA2_/MRDRNA2_35002_c0~~gnl/MRDRNA2_/MRDRNA2_35002_c0_seq1.p1  ORF type:complete len:436 (+),score=60.79 gnl/MRDRNA2_/MRDRNA2_35002_c0_seq1:61-1368(+)
MVQIEEGCRYYEVPSDGIDSQPKNTGRWFKAGVALIGGSCVMLFSIVATSAFQSTLHKTEETQSINFISSPHLLRFPQIVKGPVPIPPKFMGKTFGRDVSSSAAQVHVGVVGTPKQVEEAPLPLTAFPTTDRRAVLSGLAASLGLMSIPGFHAPARAAAQEVDWPAVKADILDVMAKDENRGPTLVRLAWHSSGTYDKMTKTGGSSGGTMRFEEELAHGANAGLNKAVAWLEPVFKKHEAEGLQHADLYTLAGAVAIEAMGGPPITWRAGRIDAPRSAVPPEGRLPGADKGDFTSTANHLRDIFFRMGFDDKDIVALSGAHALGYTHKENSGFEGPWTGTPTKLTNAYYTFLLKLPWEEETVPETGNRQYGTGKKPNRLMMLESDLALIKDPKFRPYVEKYAKDQSLFFTDFAAAFSRLLELGCSGLKPVKLGAA